jgi:hypothetical protein
MDWQKDTAHGCRSAVIFLPTYIFAIGCRRLGRHGDKKRQPWNSRSPDSGDKPPQSKAATCAWIWI